MLDDKGGEGSQTPDSTVVDDKGKNPEGTAPVDAGKGKVEFSPEQQAKVDEIIKNRTEDYRGQLKEMKDELEDVKSLLTESGEEKQEKPTVISQAEWDNLSDKEKIKLAASEVLTPELKRVEETSKRAFQKSVDLEWKIFKIDHKDITSDTETTMRKLFEGGRASTFEDAYELSKNKNLDKDKLETEIREKIKAEDKTKEDAAKALRGGKGGASTSEKPLTKDEAFEKAYTEAGGK